MESKVLVIGTGGHAKVIIDILANDKKYDIIQCMIEDIASEVIGLKTNKNDRLLDSIHCGEVQYAFIALGDNKLRHDIALHINQKLGLELINVISPFSHISSSVKIGTGIAVMPGAVINVDTVIENNVIINTGATVDHDCIIGESAHIAPGSHLAGCVRVGKGTFLGIGCKVIDKISIGEWSKVGAGAVVIKDIAPYTTSVGIPAKVIKNLIRR